MHPSPDVLALLALGEQAGTPAEQEHVAGLYPVSAEVAEPGPGRGCRPAPTSGDDLLYARPTGSGRRSGPS